MFGRLTWNRATEMPSIHCFGEPEAKITMLDFNLFSSIVYSTVQHFVRENKQVPEKFVGLSDFEFRRKFVVFWL